MYYSSNLVAFFTFIKGILTVAMTPMIVKGKAMKQLRLFNSKKFKKKNAVTGPCQSVFVHTAIFVLKKSLTIAKIASRG